MLALRLNGTYLTLAANTSANINLVNPVFDRDGAERLYTFPFKLLNTPENLNALDHANRMDRRGGSAAYAGAEFYIEHQLFASGILELDGQPFTSKSIKAVFKNLVPDLFEELEKIQVNTLLETVPVPQVTDAFWKFALSVLPNSAGIDYSINIVGNVYSFTTPGPVVKAAVTQGLALAINADLPGLASEGFHDELRLFSSEANKYDIDLASLVNLDAPEVITPGQAAQSNLQAFVNGINFSPDNRLSFPYVYWKKFYNGLVTAWSDRVNAWVDGDFIKNEATDNDFNWKTTFVPFVRLPYVLEKIAEAIPDYFSEHLGFFKDDPDGNSLLVFNNRSLDLLYHDRYSTTNFGTFKYLNGFKDQIDLNQHVPDLTAADFIKIVLQHFALYLQISGKRISFIKKQSQLNQPPVDWTDRCEPAFRATRKSKNGFTLEHPDLRPEDRNFRPHPVYDGQLAALISGCGHEKHTLPIGTCKMDNGIVALPVNGTLKCPAISQPGSSDEGGIGDNDFSFRFLFDRGIAGTSSSNNYVLASHDNSDQAGNQTGDLSFDLHTDDGLYQQHHKGLLRLLSDGEPITIPVRLGIGELLRIRKWENSRRLVRLPEGQVTAVIRSVQFRASAKGISIAKVELVKEP